MLCELKKTLKRKPGTILIFYFNLMPRNIKNIVFKKCYRDVLTDHHYINFGYSMTLIKKMKKLTMRCNVLNRYFEHFRVLFYIPYTQKSCACKSIDILKSTGKTFNMFHEYSGDIISIARV